SVDSYVFDTRRTVPVSNLAALESLIEHFRGGFVSAQDFGSLSIQLKSTLPEYTYANIGPPDDPRATSNRLPVYAVSHWKQYAEPVYGFTFPSWDFTWNGLDDSLYGPYSPNQSTTAVLLESEANYVLEETVPETAQKIGCDTRYAVFARQAHIFQEIPYILQCDMTTLQPSGTRYGPSDIEKATINIELRNLTVTERFGEWSKVDYDNSGQSAAWWEQQYTTQEMPAPPMSVITAVMEQTHFSPNKYRTVFTGASISVN
ncbi:unnamed protein product, partial [marine sediment metagenome]